MAISLVGSKAFTGATMSGGDSISLTDLGAALAENDYVYIVLVSGSLVADNTASMVVSGYTTHASLYSNNSNDTNVVVQSKKMGATPDTSFTTPTLSGSRFSGVVLALRGVDTTTPMDVVATTDTGINSDLANPPSITPLTAGAWVFAAYAAAQQTSTAWTAPSGLTDFIQGANDLGRAGVGLKRDWASGAFDPAAVTGGNANANNSWAAASLALRPAPAGGKPKVWNGSAWVEKPLKVWNGSAWVEKPLKVWNGSAWVLA